MTDYFVLRRHLVRPWQFLRLRVRGMGGPYYDVPMSDGGTVRIRNVPMDRHVFHRIFARDEYRLGGVAPGSWDTVIDVGAHAGFVAVRAAPLARRVLCYEPAPDNFDVLSRNTARFPHVRSFQAAVADKPGTLGLALADNPAAYSAVGSGRRKVDVPCVTLAQVLDEHAVARCDLLKLNCEGVEYAALYALPEGRWPSIRRLIVQYHPVSGHTGEALGAHVEKLGFRVELRRSRKHAGKGTLFAARPV